MSIDAASYYSSFTGSNSTSSTTTGSDNSSLDQVDFLTLLTTQLQYQDPTNPTDNTAMINQMTNYAMLDEDVAQNENLEAIINQLDALASLSTAGLIGEEVMAPGGSFSVEGGEATGVTIDLQDDASEVGINIYDSEGELVDTIYFDNLEEGEIEITGAQIMAEANLENDGEYTALVFATDSDGASVEAYIKSTGTISSIGRDDSNNITLTLDDGREVSIGDVSFIS
ncbi:flagellar hook assembly protein FlgD [Maridesulfovibrio salexigens]|uniref:Basal-body rod modification protein FlgD n=1 Tax=Maridesulfovibrio salexigens (strain ATCC 14822 / DSM 2638 / NCIMB 8403 / VKM B-1763) TaxID=526222 RepID=C6BZU8_MARSD|nr:flagellar hook capping FlgD N-terminal domain-containing protein [Maridesulfovibrio salexigens]ACS79005.1 flagellar hook capping protein [Maridesulfovibrio salexigens DSM 2638]